MPSVQVPASQPAIRFDVLRARARYHVFRERRHGRLLVPMDLFQVVADELLVEARLRPPGVILVLRPVARGIGCQNLVAENDLAVELSELELRIRKSEAAGKRVLTGARENIERQIAELRAKVLADDLGGLLE